jgi:anhydro-N-acetylmuramic acid kinase
VAHVPPSQRTTIAGTLQLGAPGAIAALTGVTTVGDFRVGDLALGGQGAPLAPVADWLLRRSEEKGRVILNIGGIANVTFLPRGCAREAVVAFDTGPGNMVVDALHRALYGGREGFDRGGAHALEGRAHSDVLATMRNHPFFALPPPKSAGHAEFGPQFAWQMQKIAEAHGLTREDSMATGAALTAETIADALETYVMPRGSVDEIFVTGGGVHNEAVMQRLRDRLAPEIEPIDALGVPADVKEAVDFAVLAREALFGRPNAMPGVTGAARALVLGSIAMGGHA